MQKKIILFSVFFLLIFIASNSSAAENDLLQQGIAQYKAENFEEALDLLRKAKASLPESTLVAYYLGLTYKHLEKHREAKEQFLAALNLTPPVQDAYTELIETLYILDDLDTARLWLGRAEQSGVKPAHIAFLDGLVSIKEGRYQNAVTTLNRAKSLDTSLSQPADFQIAFAQIKMRRFDDAQKSLQTISAMDPTSDIATFAQEYERALVKTLKAANKWKFSAGLAYQYDDNVLLKPTASIPGIEISHESDSSVIGTLGIITPSVTSGAWSASGRYNFYSNIHAALHTHDIVSHAVSVVPVYALEKGSLSFPLSYSHVWLHQQEYLGLLSFRPTLQVMLAPGHIIQASAGYSWQEMKKPALDPDEDRDARIYAVSAGYLHPFNQGRNLFNLIYEFSRQETDGRNWENIGHRVSAGLLVPLFRNDLNLVISGDFFFQDYSNASTIFGKTKADNTFIGTHRKDLIYTGSANLRWEMSKQVSMNLQYTHTRADSNIFVYDYRRNIGTVGIEIQF